MGDTIEVDERQKIGGVKRFNRIARLAVVAMLIICIAGGSLGYMSASASSYVSMDAGETSLEFGVNRFGRVISVEGLDENSEAFAREIAAEVKNKKFDEAMNHAVSRMEESGLIEESAADAVVAGVTSGSEKQKEELQQGLQNTFPHKDGKGPKLYMTDVTAEEREEAIEKKQSPGMFVFQRRDDWSEEDWEDFYEEHEQQFDWDDWDEEVRPMPPQGFGPKPPQGEMPQPLQEHMGPPGPMPPDDFDPDNFDDDIDEPDEPEDSDDWRLTPKWEIYRTPPMR